MNIIITITHQLKLTISLWISLFNSTIDFCDRPFKRQYSNITRYNCTELFMTFKLLTIVKSNSRPCYIADGMTVMIVDVITSHA